MLSKSDPTAGQRRDGGRECSEKGMQWGFSSQDCDLRQLNQNTDTNESQAISPGSKNDFHSGRGPSNRGPGNRIPGKSAPRRRRPCTCLPPAALTPGTPPPWAPFTFFLTVWTETYRPSWVKRCAQAQSLCKPALRRRATGDAPIRRLLQVPLLVSDR